MKTHYAGDEQVTTQSLAYCSSKSPSARVQVTNDRTKVTCGTCKRIANITPEQLEVERLRGQR